jgi:hypothetical protein
MFGSNTLRLSAAAGAVAVAAVIGVALWAGQPPVGPGAETARPTSSPRQIAHSLSGGLTALEPGAWSVADSFPFRASFDVPDGWQGTAHGGSYTGLFRDGDSQSEPFLAFAVVGNVYVDPCHYRDAGLLIPSVGPSVDDLTAALVAMEGGNVSAPIDVIVGGYPGKQLTITAPESFEQCNLGERGLPLDGAPPGA